MNLFGVGRYACCASVTLRPGCGPALSKMPVHAGCRNTKTFRPKKNTPVGSKVVHAPTRAGYAVLMAARCKAGGAGANGGARG